MYETKYGSPEKWDSNKLKPKFSNMDSFCSSTINATSKAQKMFDGLAEKGVYVGWKLKVASTSRVKRNIQRYFGGFENSIVPFKTNDLSIIIQKVSPDTTIGNLLYPLVLSYSNNLASSGSVVEGVVSKDNFFELINTTKKEKMASLYGGGKSGRIIICPSL